MELKEKNAIQIETHRGLFLCVIPTGVCGAEGPRIPAARAVTSLTEKPTRPTLRLS
jgi:hypothetical protein